VYIRVLGSGCGSGIPAWNDGSEMALRARKNEASVPRREGAALAVSADGERYAILEAPLHLPSTLSKSQPFAPQPGTRKSPIDALVLTSADLDASAGILGFASSLSVRILSPIGLRDGLAEAGGAYHALDAVWTACAWDRPFLLDREEVLEARFFPLPGPAPGPLRESAPKIGRSRCGIRITDLRTGVRLVWAPRITRFDSACLAELRSADVRFIDGTYYASEEVRSNHPGAIDSAAAGHAPIDGKDGSLVWLAGMRGRSLYIHLASSNPACDTGSPESERIQAAQVEVARDGQEFSF